MLDDAGSGDRSEAGIRRRFLFGWALLCAVAFLAPFLKTQIDMARTFGDRGLIARYYLTQGDVSVARIEPRLSSSTWRRSLIDSRGFNAHWGGDLWIDAPGRYRFALKSGQGSMTLTVAGAEGMVSTDPVTGLLYVETEPRELQRGWYPLSANWSANRGGFIALLMARDEGPLKDVEGDLLRFSPAEGEKVRAKQRKRGGITPLAKVIWRLFLPGLRPEGPAK